MTGAGAYVEGAAGEAIDFLQSAEMRFRDIQDMNVVANGGAVWRGVIAAEDGDVRSAALDGLQD